MPKTRQRIQIGRRNPPPPTLRRSQTATGDILRYRLSELAEDLVTSEDGRWVEYDDHAATIARLTAERNEAKLEIQCLSNVIKGKQDAADYWTKRAEAAEKELARITAIGEDNLRKLQSYIDAMPQMEGRKL